MLPLGTAERIAKVRKLGINWGMCSKHSNPRTRALLLSAAWPQLWPNPQVLGTAGLLFLLFTGRLAFTNVVGFCIALSNAFGLIAGKNININNTNNNNNNNNNNSNNDNNVECFWADSRYPFQLFPAWSSHHGSLSECSTLTWALLAFGCCSIGGITLSNAFGLIAGSLPAVASLVISSRLAMRL